MTVAEVSRVEGIGLQTLYNWRDKAKLQGRPVPGNKPTPDQWSAEAKLAVVIETGSMSEAELSEYCRAKGLYVEQVKAWKADSLKGFASSREQELEAKQPFLASSSSKLQLIINTSQQKPAGLPIIRNIQTMNSASSSYVK